MASIAGWSRDLGHLRVLNKLSPRVDLETSVVARVVEDDPGLNFLLMGPGLVVHQPTGVSWFQAAYHLGLGAGCGGAREGIGGCNRAAGGLSVGLDMAVGPLWDLKLYTAHRLQVSVAEDIPTTLWGLHAVGLHWDAWNAGWISLELSPWWYKNRVEDRDAAIITLGLGLLWDGP